MKKKLVVSVLSLMILTAMMLSGCTQSGSHSSEKESESQKETESQKESESQEESESQNDSDVQDETESQKDSESEENSGDNIAFMKSLKIGEEQLFDLNKDGKADSIYYNVILDTVNFTDPVVKLMINGTEYSKEIVSILNPNEKEFYLIDIDESDSFVEIAIMDYGASDDEFTGYYRYDGKNLQYLGYTQGFISDEETYGDGKGYIYSKIIAGYGTTNPVLGRYTIGQFGTIEEVREWRYYDEIESKPTHEILMDFDGYSRPLEDEIPITITRDFGPVALYATDCKDWIAIKNEKGDICFIRMSNGYTEWSEIDINEILSGLRWAG